MTKQINKNNKKKRTNAIMAKKSNWWVEREIK
jgi:hypothetical protein